MKKTKKRESGGMLSRRKFLSHAALGSTAIVFMPVKWKSDIQGKPKSKWLPDAGKYRFHLVGHAHVDPVWLWPWSEGMAVVHSTFRAALDRMKLNPEFAFISSSAQFYQWVSDNDPQMLEEIRARVEEGRWNAVGGWWIEPDMNMPCGESMIRQGLYGQLAFQKLLGKRAKVAFNPDAFGHASTLPQIVRLQGMENYVFMRPAPHEKDIHNDLFIWEGVDGTRILAYRIPVSYNDTGSVRERIEKVVAGLKDQPFKTAMTFYGAGDHGGGATDENIASVSAIRKEPCAPVIFFSTPEKFFNEVRSGDISGLDIVKDDLQHHARGCYTAESEIKKLNRMAESALITAEKLCAAGSLAWGCNYPIDEFTNAWKRVLFLQFHDSLAGTSLPEHYSSAKEGFGYASDIANTWLFKSLQKLEWSVPAEDPGSEYLIAFNHHAWKVSGYVEYDLGWSDDIVSEVTDGNGNILEHQWTAGTTETGNRRRIVIKLTLPAYGYCQIRIREGQKPPAASQVIVRGNTAENEFLLVRFTKEGTIGIFDKTKSKEVFIGRDTGCRGVIVDDPSDTWSHDVKSFPVETGSFGNAELTVLENGPLRAVIRMKTSYGKSLMAIDWVLCSGAAYLEARVTLDWHEHLKMLKFSFPADIDSPVVTYETPYGFIVREANGNEEPGQRWIDISGPGSGLTIINDAKYGYSVNANDLRVSVARSAVYAHHNPRVLDMESEHIWQDQGIQEFRILIFPHSGNWREAKIPRIAEEFMQPPSVIYQGIHRGSLPKSGSFIEIVPENIIVSSIKKSENDDDIIIRCVETSGIAASASLDLRFAGIKWKGDFHQCEIKTLRINKKSGQVIEVNLLEE